MYTSSRRSMPTAWSTAHSGGPSGRRPSSGSSRVGDFRGWKGLARLAVGRRNALLYGRRIDFVLPTGQQGVRWFYRCGFAPSRIFPYGYWVEDPQAAGDSRPAPGPVRLMFLGQLIPRKGVDLTLRALAALRGQNWEFVVMGAGAQEPELRAMAHRLDIAGRSGFRRRGPIRRRSGRSPAVTSFSCRAVLTGGARSSTRR